MHKTFSILVFPALFLTACGSDSVETEEPKSAGNAQLQSVTSSELNDYLQRALTTGLTNSDDGNTSGGTTDQVSNADSPTSQESSGGASFSKTTLQDGGVDEADLIKTDGQTIYAIDNRESGTTRIRVMELSSDGNALTESSAIQLGNTNRAFTDLYLDQNNNQLIALQSPEFSVWDNWFEPATFRQQTTDVAFVNTTSRQPTGSLEFDGSLINSRRVGDKLYLVLRHYPYFDGLDIYPDTTEQKQNNAAILNNKSVEDFLPRVTQNRSVTTSAVSADNCYIDQQQSASTSDIITLVALDLTNQTWESVCYAGSTEAIYASTQALYLATTRWEYNWFAPENSYDDETTTSIHKFAFTDSGFDYRGSGEVDGHLGNRQSDKSFRFGEQDGALRVFTVNESRPWLAFVDLAEPAAVATRSSADESSPVMLTVFRESDTEKKLEVVAQLPNEQRTNPIGKEGEQLYATRFMGDKAFAVTFRATDPLYMIDTSDLSDPYIAGELEIDGYSEYLQPLSESLLLGVGKDAIPDASNGDSARGAWYQGVKLSLIDISNPTAPVETATEIIGKRGTESAALYNHHALSLLTTDTSTKIALPVTLRDRQSQYYTGHPWDSYDYTHSGLYRYEIDLQNKTFSSNSPAPLVIREWQGQGEEFWGVETNHRSILINDSVHYLHDGLFTSQDWAGNTNAVGPQ